MNTPMTRSPLPAAALVLLIALTGSLARASTCSVPGTYPSLGEAVADPTCSSITLSATSLTEQVTITRSLTLQGAGVGASTLRGRILVENAGTVALDDFTIDTGGCFASGLEVSGTATEETQSGDLSIVGAATGGSDCPIFRDGFDIGSTARWSASVP